MGGGGSLQSKVQYRDVRRLYHQFVELRVEAPPPLRAPRRRLMANRMKLLREGVVSQEDYDAAVALMEGKD